MGDGRPKDIEARYVQAMEIFDGRDSHVVQHVEHLFRDSEVIEVHFHDDEAVLAWLPSGRKVHQLDSRRAFAVRGEVQGNEHNHIVRPTFISTGDMEQSSATSRRTYSADRALSPHMRRRLARSRR